MSNDDYKVQEQIRVNKEILRLTKEAPRKTKYARRELNLHKKNETYPKND